MLLIPLALTTLITVHLAMIMRQHHSQFPGPGGASETSSARRCGRPTRCARSGCCSRSPPCCSCVGGLIQINPIWQWGPFHPYLSENGAQPDWYIGWLIGALRLMPNFEPTIGGHTIDPQPVLGRCLFPLVVFGVMFAWPAIERRITGDHRRHDLLDRPRDRPIRTAVGAAFLSWVVIIFAVGSTDRLFYRLHISYHRPDPFLARRHLGAPDHRLLRHPQRVPGPAAKRRASTALLGGRGHPPAPGRHGRGALHGGCSTSRNARRAPVRRGASGATTGRSVRRR